LSKKEASSEATWALLASGVGEARAEALRLRHMVNRGRKLIETSDHRDHFYQMAGDLIVGVPERLDKIEALLDRTSYALVKIGEPFFEGRIPLADRALVEDAVQHSQGLESLSKRVADRWLAQQTEGDE